MATDPSDRPARQTSAPSERTEPGNYTPSALPPTGARVLAFVAILFAGLCGGIIGYAFVELQVEGDTSVVAGLGALVGAIGGAVGVAVVATLALRAMGEWRAVEHDE